MRAARRGRLPLEGQPSPAQRPLALQPAQRPQIRQHAVARALAAKDGQPAGHHCGRMPAARSRLLGAKALRLDLAPGGRRNVQHMHVCHELGAAVAAKQRQQTPADVHHGGEVARRRLVVRLHHRPLPVVRVQHPDVALVAVARAPAAAKHVHARPDGAGGVECARPRRAGLLPRRRQRPHPRLLARLQHHHVAQELLAVAQPAVHHHKLGRPLLAAHRHRNVPAARAGRRQVAARGDTLAPAHRACVHRGPVGRGRAAVGACEGISW
mmetsp:Transcript_35639/g.92577  ORF Transcript_35639/g.92577 Transcript_35639/m.92577 type:complete len:268 (+) Transcript_35639:387-1190(+)